MKPRLFAIHFVGILGLGATLGPGSGKAFAQAGGWTHGGAVVRLTTAADRVGIGTNDPAAKVHVKTTDPGSAALQIIENGNSGNSAADAILQLLVAGGNGGDPYLRFDVGGATAYSMGIDNSDEDRFKISLSTSLGVADILKYLPRSKEWVLCTSIGADSTWQAPILNLYNFKAGEVSIRLNKARDDSGSGEFWLNPWIMHIPPSTSEMKLWITRDMQGNYFGLDEDGKVSVGYSLPNNASGVARLGVVGGKNEKQFVVRAHSNQTDSISEWQDSTGSPLVTISKGGEVGIGTSRPASTLHVAGDGTISLAPRSSDPAPASGIWKLYIFDNGKAQQLRVLGPSGTVNTISALTP
ncbi:MAG: hypothetical protein HY717_17315 [Planctomycetes bacterium]|nr:hypothetical protein [Planctomycetota bacterium]